MIKWLRHWLFMHFDRDSDDYEGGLTMTNIVDRLWGVVLIILALYLLSLMFG